VTRLPPVIPAQRSRRAGTCHGLNLPQIPDSLGAGLGFGDDGGATGSAPGAYFFFASNPANVPSSAARRSISGAIFQRAPYLAS